MGCGASKDFSDESTAPIKENPPTAADNEPLTAVGPIIPYPDDDDPITQEHISAAAVIARAAQDGLHQIQCRFMETLVGITWTAEVKLAMARIATMRKESANSLILLTYGGKRGATWERRQNFNRDDAAALEVVEAASRKVMCVEEERAAYGLLQEGLRIMMLLRTRVK